MAFDTSFEYRGIHSGISRTMFAEAINLERYNDHLRPSLLEAFSPDETEERLSNHYYYNIKDLLSSGLQSFAGSSALTLTPTFSYDDRLYKLKLTYKMPRTMQKKEGFFAAIHEQFSCYDYTVGGDDIILEVTLIDTEIAENNVDMHKSSYLGTL